MRVWFDCSAAAHPVVLRPVIEGFLDRGDDVLVTARDYGQTVGILDLLGIDHQVVGRHGGASTIGKARALAGRSFGLLGPVTRFDPDLAVGHGSVDLALVSRLRGVPSVQMQDYEFAGLQRQLAFRSARRVLAPDSIPVERMEAAGANRESLFRYAGLKEDYYLSDFVPDPGVPEELGIDPEKILVVVRPPPETSAYHRENPLYDQVLDRIEQASGTVEAVVIPRTSAQAEAVAGRRARNLIVPTRAVDAQSLIAFADLVVSAGGTMNREAVSLGTPVFTTFTGRMGGVDEALIAEGRMRQLEDVGQLDLVKKQASPGPVSPRDPDIIVDAIRGALD
jgi:predicted glycosyltransferase